LKILLDYSVFTGHSERASLDIPTQFNACIQHISGHLEQNGISGGYMLIINGVYLSTETINEVKEGALITVLPLMSGG